jgi:hypothetical protein
MSDDRLKIVLSFGFAFAVLFGIEGLCAAVALGKVEEKTSYGLPILLDALKMIVSFWIGSMSQGLWGKKEG